MIADFFFSCAFHQTNVITNSGSVWFREVEAVTNQVSAAFISECRYGFESFNDQCKRQKFHLCQVENVIIFKTELHTIP